MLGSAGPTEGENIFEDQQFNLLSLRNLGQVALPPIPEALSCTLKSTNLNTTYVLLSA